MGTNLNISTSFRLANDEPIVFKNYKQASTAALQKLKFDLDSEKEPDEIIEDLVSKKRKIYNDMQPNKRAKQSTPLIKSPTKKSNGYKNPSTSLLSCSSPLDSDIDWSDDGEFFKNVSLIEETKTSQQDADRSPANNSKTMIKSRDNEANSRDHEHDSGAISDEELEWSDCDSELNSSIARFDRSVLQEIAANKSGTISREPTS